MQEATQLELSPDGQSLSQPQSVSSLQDKARTLSLQPQDKPLESMETLLQQHDKDKMVPRHIPRLRAVVESQAFKNVLVDEMDMMLSRAATLIQANWRGYRLRQKLISQMMAAKAIQEAWRRFNTRRLLRSGRPVEKKVSVEEGDIPYHAPQQVRFQHPEEDKPPVAQPIMVSKETQFPSSDSLATCTHQLALLQARGAPQPGAQAPCSPGGPGITFLPHQTVAIRLPCPVSLDAKCHPCLLTRTVRNACFVHVEGDTVKTKQVTARASRAGAPGPPPCGRHAQAVHGSLRTQTQAHMETEVLRAPPQTGPALGINRTPSQMYPVAMTKTPPQPCLGPTATIAKTPPQVYPAARVTKTPLQACLAAMVNKTPPQPCSAPTVTITKVPPQTYQVAPMAKNPAQTCPVAAMAKASPQTSQPAITTKTPLQPCLVAMVNKTPPQPCPVSKTPTQMRPTTSMTNTSPQTRPAAMMAKISPQICLLASMIKSPAQTRPMATAGKAPPQTCPVPAMAKTPTQMRPAVPMTKTPLQTCPATAMAKTPSQILPGASVTKTPPQKRLAAMVTKTPAQFRSMAAILKTLCLPPSAAGNLKSSPPATVAAGIPNASFHTCLNGPKAKAMVNAKQTAGMVKVSSHSYAAEGKVKYFNSPHVGARAPKTAARPPSEAERMKAFSQKQVKTETASNTNMAIGMSRASPWVKMAEDRNKSSLQAHLRTDVVKVQSQVYMPVETAVALPRAQPAPGPAKIPPQTHRETCPAKMLPQERLATCLTMASSQGQLLAELTAALPQAHPSTCPPETLPQTQPPAKLTTTQAQTHLGTCLSKALPQAQTPAKMTNAPSFTHLGTFLSKTQSQAHLAAGVIKVQSRACLPTGLTKVLSQAQLVTETAKCLSATHHAAELSGKTQSQPLLTGFKASTQPCQHASALGTRPRAKIEDRLTQIQPHGYVQGKATQGPRQGASETQSMLVPLLASAAHSTCNTESWGDSEATRAQSPTPSPASPCPEELAASQLASLCAELAAELGSQEDLRALLAKALSQEQVRSALNQALSKKVLGSTVAKALPQGMLGTALMKVLSWGELGLALSRTVSPAELRAELTKAKQGKLADVLSKALTEEEWAALSEALCQGELGAVLSQSLSQAAARTGVLPKATSKTSGSRMTVIPAPVEMDYRASPTAMWGPALGPVRPQPSKVRVPQDGAWEGFFTGWPAGFLEEMGDGAMFGGSPCSPVVSVGASLASSVITAIHQYPLITALDPSGGSSSDLYLSPEVSEESACSPPEASALASDVSPVERDTGPSLPKPPHPQQPPSLWQPLVANGVGPSTSQQSVVAGGTAPSSHKPHAVSRVAPRLWASSGEGRVTPGPLPRATGGGRAAHSHQCTAAYGRSICSCQSSGVNKLPFGMYRSSTKAPRQPSVVREETMQRTQSPNHKRASVDTRERINKVTPGPARASSVTRVSLGQPQTPKAGDLVLGLLPDSMAPGHRWALKTPADVSVFPASRGSRVARTLSRTAVPRQERTRTLGASSKLRCLQEQVTSHILDGLAASLPQGPDSDMAGSLSQGSTDYGPNVSNSQSSLPSCSSLSLSTMSVASLTAADLLEEESWEASFDAFPSGEAAGSPQRPGDREETQRGGQGHTTPNLCQQPSAGSELIPILHHSSVSGRVTLSVHWDSDDLGKRGTSSGQSSMSLMEKSQKSYRTGLTRSLSLDNVVPTIYQEPSVASRLTSSLSQPSVVNKVAPNLGQPFMVSNISPSVTEPSVCSKVTPSLARPSVTSRVVPSPARPSLTSGEVPSLAQASMTGRVAPSPAQPSVTGGVVPRLAHTSMTGEVAPSLAWSSVTSGVSPSLARPSRTGEVIPSLVWPSVTSGVTLSLAHPSVTSRVVPIPAQPSVTSGEVPNLAQASVTGRVAPGLGQPSVSSGVVPSLAQASMTGRVVPSLAWPSVTGGVAPSLAQASMISGVASGLARPSGTTGVAPSLAQVSMTSGVAPHLARPSMPSGVAPSLAQASVTSGVASSLARPSGTSGVVPSLAQASVTSVVAPSLARPSGTSGGVPSLAQASVTSGVAPRLARPSVTGEVIPNLAQASVTSGVDPHLAQPSGTSGVVPSLAQASVTSGVAPRLARPSVTGEVIPNLAQASMTSGVAPRLARPSVTSEVIPNLAQASVTSGVAPHLVRPSGTSGVVPSLAQASVTSVVAPRLARPSVTGEVIPNLAQASMTSGVAPSLARPSGTSGVVPSLARPSVTSEVIPNLAQASMTSGVAPSLARPSVTSGVAPSLAQASGTSGVVPSLAQASVTSGVAPSLAQPSGTSRVVSSLAQASVIRGVAPSPAQPSVTSEEAPSLAQPSVTSGVIPSPAQPSVTGEGAPSLAQPSVTRGVAPSPAQPSVTDEGAPSLAQASMTSRVTSSLAKPCVTDTMVPSLTKPSMTDGVAPSLPQLSVTGRVAPSLGQPSVACVVAPNLALPTVTRGVAPSPAQPFVANRGPLSLFQPSVVAGTNCAAGPSSWAPKVGSNLPSGVNAVTPSLCHPSFVTEVPLSTSYSSATGSTGQDLSQPPVAPRMAPCQDPLMVGGVASNPQAPEFSQVSLTFHQPRGASGGRPSSAPNLYQASGASGKDSCLDQGTSVRPGALFQGMATSIPTGTMAAGMFPNMSRGTVAAGMFLSMSPGPLSPSTTGNVCQQSMATGAGLNQFQVVSGVTRIASLASVAGAPLIHEQAAEVGPGFLRASVANRLGTSPIKFSQANTGPNMSQVNVDLPISLNQQHPSVSTIVAPGYEQANDFSQEPAVDMVSGLVPGSVGSTVITAVAPDPTASGVAPSLPTGSVIRGMGQSQSPGSVISSVPPHLPPAYVVGGVAQTLPEGSVIYGIGHSLPPGSVISGVGQGLPPDPVASAVAQNFPPGSVAAGVPPSLMATSGDDGKRQSFIRPSVSFTIPHLISGSVVDGMGPGVSPGFRASSVVPATDTGELNQGLILGSMDNVSGLPSTVGNMAQSLPQGSMLIGISPRPYHGALAGEGSAAPFQAFHATGQAQLHPQASEANGTTQRVHRVPTVLQRASQLSQVLKMMPFETTGDQAMMKPEDLNKAVSQVSVSSVESVVLEETPWMVQNSLLADISQSHSQEFLPDGQRPLLEMVPSQTKSLPNGVAIVPPQSMNFAKYSMAGGTAPTLPPRSATSWGAPGSHLVAASRLPGVHVESVKAIGAPLTRQASVAHIVPQSPSVTHMRPQSHAHKMGASPIVSASPKVAHSRSRASSVPPGSIAGVGTPGTSQRSGTTYKAPHVFYPPMAARVASGGFQAEAVPRAREKPASGDLAQSSHTFLGCRKSYRSVHGCLVSDMLESNVTRVLPLYATQGQVPRSSRESPGHAKSAPLAVIPIIRTTEVAHSVATPRLPPGFRRVSLGYESSPDGSRRPLFTPESMPGSWDFQSAVAPADSHRESLPPTVLQDPVDAGTGGGQGWNSAAVPSGAAGPMDSASAPNGAWHLARASGPWDTVGREAAVDLRQSGELVASMQAVEKLVIRAVVTIQACARGYLVRRTIKVWHQWAIIIQAAWRGYCVRRDLARLCQAATIIQAKWRGFHIRRNKTQLALPPGVRTKTHGRTKSTSDHRCFQSCQPHVCPLCQSLSPRLGSPPSVVMLVGSSPRTCHMCGHTLPTRVVHGMGRGSRVQAGTPMGSRSPQQSCRQNKAATAIQSAWRGFTVRRQLRQQQMAAKMLQANWRGHHTRASLTTDALLGSAAWDNLQHTQWPGV